MTARPVEHSLLTLHALGFIHPGTGQSTGVVDLPIQREVHTGFPMIASSGLKGSLRERAEQDWGSASESVIRVFGPDSDRIKAGQEAAGALVVSDARILAFPVRSLQQVYVWITCELVLTRLRRDLRLIRVADKDLPPIISVANGSYCAAAGDSRLSGALILEECRFAPDSDNTKRHNVKGLAEYIAGSAPNIGLAPSLQDLSFVNRLVVIGNEDFQHLVRHATQISARNALNARKTTTGDGGNLWYEETLPPETLMYAVLMAHAPRLTPAQQAAPLAAGSPSHPSDATGVMTEFQRLFDARQSTVLQVGGNETVGHGWCQLQLREFAATGGGGTA